MMNVLKLSLIMFFILCVLPLKLNAHSPDDNVESKMPRQGFYIGFGINIAQEVTQYQSFFSGLNLQIGGGVNEMFVLYADLQSIATNTNSVDVSNVNLLLQLKTILNQKYPFYVETGVGFGNYETITDGFEYAETDMGFVAQLGLGYECRIGKRFFIAPEAIYRYQNIQSLNHNFFGGEVLFGWYF